jgi:hypothetical protein
MIHDDIAATPLRISSGDENNAWAYYQGSLSGLCFRDLFEVSVSGLCFRTVSLRLL